MARMNVPHISRMARLDPAKSIGWMPWGLRDKRGLRDAGRKKSRHCDKPAAPLRVVDPTDLGLDVEALAQLPYFFLVSGESSIAGAIAIRSAQNIFDVLIRNILSLPDDHGERQR